MKFRLFGGMDCPDTLLSQLSAVSRFPLGIVTRIADHVTTVLLSHTTSDQEHFNECAVQNQFFFNNSDIAPLNTMEVAQALVAAHTVIVNIIRRNLTADIATHELNLLGLELETAEAIAGAATAFEKQLRGALLHKTILLSAKAIGVCAVTRRSVDKEGTGTDPVSFIELSLSTPGRCSKIEMSALKAQALLAELVSARWLLIQHRSKVVE